MAYPSTSGPQSFTHPRAEVQVYTVVTGMTYWGGVVGLFANRHRKLEDHIKVMNGQAFRLRHVLPGRFNVLALVLQIGLLLATLGIFTVEPGETLIFEKIS